MGQRGTPKGTVLGICIEPLTEMQQQCFKCTLEDCELFDMTPKFIKKAPDECLVKQFFNATVRQR